MEAVLFWFGSIMTYIGGTLLYGAYSSRAFAFTRNGQVVGFATGPIGSKPLAPGATQNFRTVLRFMGIDGNEYFLVESIGSAIPNYSMGEFVPLLLSKRDTKKVFFNTEGDRRSGVIWFLAGLCLMLIYLALHKGSLVSAVLTSSVIMIAVAGLSTLAKFSGFDWRKLINSGRDLGTLAPPIVVTLEESKNIPWAPADKVRTPRPVVVKTKQPWFLQTFFFYLALSCFCAAAVFFYKTYQFMQTSSQARGSIAFVKEKPLYKNIVWYVPVVRFYGHKKNIIEFEDPTGVPLPMFASGEETPVLFDKKNPQNARVDYGSWNQWVCYIFFILGAIFILCSRSATLHAYKVRNKKVTPIHIRKVS